MLPVAAEDQFSIFAFQHGLDPFPVHDPLAGRGPVTYAHIIAAAAETVKRVGDGNTEEIGVCVITLRTGVSIHSWGNSGNISLLLLL